MKTKRCRHAGTWLLAGGSYEWCYGCGALRRMRETGIAQVSPTSTWLSPSTKGGNPWEKWNEKSIEFVMKQRLKKP